jgi:hypothetical protein
VPGTDVITVSDHLSRRSLGMCRGEGIPGNQRAGRVKKMLNLGVGFDSLSGLR